MYSDILDFEIDEVIIGFLRDNVKGVKEENIINSIQLLLFNNSDTLESDLIEIIVSDGYTIDSMLMKHSITGDEMWFANKVAKITDEEIEKYKKK